MADKQEMLNKIKLRLGIEQNDTAHDDILLLMLDDALMAITIYCNRHTFPWQLEYVARSMVLNEFSKENGESVASIKRGDTQITYANTISVQNMTAEQRDVCNKYRHCRMA